MSCSLFYSVDLRREQPGFFDNEKQSFKHWEKNKKKKKNVMLYQCRSIEKQLFFKKKNKMIGVSQT